MISHPPKLLFLLLFYSSQHVQYMYSFLTILFCSPFNILHTTLNSSLFRSFLLPIHNSIPSPFPPLILPSSCLLLLFKLLRFVYLCLRIPSFSSYHPLLLSPGPIKITAQVYWNLLVHQWVLPLKKTVINCFLGWFSCVFPLTETEVIKTRSTACSCDSVIGSPPSSFIPSPPLYPWQTLSINITPPWH